MPHRRDREKTYDPGTMVALAAITCVVLLAMYIGLSVAAVRNNPKCSPTRSLMIISLVTLWVAPTTLSAVECHVTACAVALLAIASTIYVIFAGKRNCE